jgi:hypothetical protein
MTEAYPLTWPQGWPRTPSHMQERGFAFRQRRQDGGYGTTLVTFATARDKLYEEVQRLGALSPIVSSNHPTDRYGIPTESRRRVEDQGVAVYFKYRDKPMAMACDRFDNAAANMPPSVSLSRRCGSSKGMAGAQWSSERSRDLLRYQHQRALGRSSA